MINISRTFLKQAQKQKPKIAIGIMRPIPETVKSLKKASRYVDLIVVGARVKGFENIVTNNDDEASKVIVNLLKNKKVEGIVRGQVKDSHTLDEFFKQYNKKPIPSNRKVCPAIMRKGKYSFVVSTCSIYQGMNLEDKKYEVDRIVKYMKEVLKIKPRIGIMSTLRPTSKVGKYKLLDDMADVNKKLAVYLKKKGYKVKEYYFEYESAVWDKVDLIVPSMGLVGNAWMKALLYLGDWELLSCPYLDIGVAYEDGSRNEKDFFDHIIHCAAMINSSNY